MSILVYIESPKGKIKKTGLELAYFGAQLAKSMGTECQALCVGKVDDPGSLGKYGVTNVLHAESNAELEFEAQAYAQLIASVATEQGAKVVILANTSNGKALTGRIAIRMQAGNVSGVNALPDLANGFVVSKSVFSGKAIAHYGIQTENKVISIMGNSLQPIESGNTITPKSIENKLPSPKTKILERKTSEGIVPLPEAELVVSAGRGMKGPENWGIIEDLANVLGATTACSRPVADSGWRPHHEHVGQTGVAIRPNLYIAAGISGAIQHLAGVNNSKVIVVINKDPEAPFFKAADYGVVGDLFEVVPRLTEAIKKYKQG